MIENCLSHKIIRDFLKNHNENKWKDLIPILIEIGILNLQKAFNKIIFTYEELKKVSYNLQHQQIEKDKEKNKEINKENTMYDSLDKELEIDNKIININYQNNKGNNKLKIDSNGNNKEKQGKLKMSNEAIKEMKNNIKNNYQLFKNNISTDFKNKIIKQKQEHFKKILIHKNEQKKKDKVSYAISYDKNLKPSRISKKINNTTTNNTNIKTDFTTNPNNNYHYNLSHNYSSDKKIINFSKCKSKSKEKYLNLNLNNITKIDKIQNKEKQNYNFEKNIIKNNIIRIGGNEKPNYFKKLNNIIQKCNILKNDSNNTHDIRDIRTDKQYNKNNFDENPNNFSYNPNYFKNKNYDGTLYQRFNSNEKGIENGNNYYFSNREELENFIRKNRVEKSVFSENSAKKISTFHKNLNKSEKQIEKTSSFLKLVPKELIYINSSGKRELEKCKNKSVMKKEKEILNPLLKSYQPKNKVLKVDKSEENSPNQIYVKTEKENVSHFKINNLKEINDKNDINKDKKDELKMKKLFEQKLENKENDPFRKNISNNRYFHIFGHEAERDFSLTQIERENSGIFDSSISNENQINPDYLFKETPKNIFKNEKSNEQSLNSNENRV